MQQPADRRPHQAVPFELKSPLSTMNLSGSGFWGGGGGGSGAVHPGFKQAVLLRPRHTAWRRG